MFVHVCICVQNNFTIDFSRVKKRLKLVYIYRSYPKIKTGVGLPLIWTTLYMCGVACERRCHYSKQVNINMLVTMNTGCTWTERTTRHWYCTLMIWDAVTRDSTAVSLTLMDSWLHSTLNSSSMVCSLILSHTVTQHAYIGLNVKKVFALETANVKGKIERKFSVRTEMGHILAVLGVLGLISFAF